MQPHSFKVGDKVRITTDLESLSRHRITVRASNEYRHTGAGEIATITSIDINGVRVKEHMWHYWFDQVTKVSLQLQFEFMNDT